LSTFCFVDDLKPVPLPRIFTQLLVCFWCAALLCSAPALANNAKNQRAASATKVVPPSPGIEAERSLLEVYQLTAESRTREALVKAEALVKTYPHFRLAQLALADLLSARSQRSGSFNQFGNAPAAMAQAAASAAASAATDSSLALQNPSITREDLGQLKQQAQLRVQAQRQRPPAGMVPRELVRIGASSRYALAVDASLSRLYVFENTDGHLKLVQDFYASVGKLGLDKSSEGDRRSPAGVYYLVNEYDPKKLFDIYGKGAIALNYPNEHDRRQGRTGSGIWLHGTPKDNFARIPRTTDGCIAVANPDLQWLKAHLALRRTPIVVASKLQWAKPEDARKPHQDFERALERWRAAKSSQTPANVSAFYTNDFTNFGKPLAQWMPQLLQEMQRIGARELELKDPSYLYWRDATASNTEVMVVTFTELIRGQSQGPIKRQYWVKQGGQWKIFFEGTIA
jgi:murein L,D-transpeptidase YafK